MANPFCPSYRKVASLLYYILGYCISNNVGKKSKINNKSRKKSFFFSLQIHIFSGEITSIIFPRHEAQSLPMYYYIAYSQCPHYYCLQVWFVRRINFQNLTDIVIVRRILFIYENESLIHDHNPGKGANCTGHNNVDTNCWYIVRTQYLILKLCTG